DASLPLRRPGGSEFGDDLFDCFRFRLDRAGQRIAAESAEANAALLRHFIGLQRQAIVVDHDERAIAFDYGAKGSAVQGDNRYFFGSYVVPDVAFGPVRQREDPHVLTGRETPIVQMPEFRTLLLGIPAVVGRAVREDALLGTG